MEKVDSEKAYEYTVKEVGEEKGKAVIGNNKYEVKYSGSMKDGFTITNKEEPIIPPTPITPSKQQARKLPKSGSTMELFTLSVAGLISATGAFFELRKKKKR